MRTPPVALPAIAGMLIAFVLGATGVMLGAEVLGYPGTVALPVTEPGSAAWTEPPLRPQFELAPVARNVGYDQRRPRRGEQSRS